MKKSDSSNSYSREILFHCLRKISFCVGKKMFDDNIVHEFASEWGVKKIFVLKNVPKGPNKNFQRIFSKL